ncbi:MAG: ATP phosphoribosyltransferase, partial [Helicobacter sp.]|nr:ATP phosphoribosyltransferase [Helicobacter sp.]
TKPMLRIATKMVNLAKSYFASQAIAVELIKLYGSIELAPSVGLCDAIVDIVETGSTLKENALKIDAVILQSSAYLVANPNSFYAKRKAILNLRAQLQNVIETAR